MERPVKVNDDATTRSQFNPYITMDEKTGTVGVTFHDSRNDDGVAGTDATANDDAEILQRTAPMAALTSGPQIRN